MVRFTNKPTSLSSVNPIAPCIWIACRVMSEAASEQRALARLTVAATSLNALLSDLLDHARLEAGHERRNIQQFDVARIFNEFCGPTRGLGGSR